MAWVDLDDVKNDLGISLEDDRDDARLTRGLDAALAFIEEKRPEFNWAEESGSELPDPPAQVLLGVVRLAGRWKDKDSTIELGEMGAHRLPSVDADIARMLGIGRYRKPVIA